MAEQKKPDTNRECMLYLHAIDELGNDNYVGSEKVSIAAKNIGVGVVPYLRQLPGIYLGDGKKHKVNFVDLLFVMSERIVALEKDIKKLKKKKK